MTDESREYKVASTQDLLARFKLPEPQKNAPQHTYEFYIKEASRITGSKYFVMHQRISRAFSGKDTDHITTYLARWCREASNSSNSGMMFNFRFKQYRDASNPK